MPLIVRSNRSGHGYGALPGLAKTIDYLHLRFATLPRIKRPNEGEIDAVAKQLNQFAGGIPFRCVSTVQG